MTIELRRDGVRVVLLDIEGTTTPITFVYDVLFPYARSHLRAFLRDHARDEAVVQAVGVLREEGATDPDAAGQLDDIAGYAEWLMNRDSKSSGVKALQGLIWKLGYESGELRGEVFPDVPVAMRAWRWQGIRVAIYSSGSVLAQRLIFGSTEFGDLTTDIDAYFDTAVGPKRDQISYRTIATALGVEPGAVLFLSDISAEIDAAVEAGCQVGLVIRPGNSPQNARDDWAVVSRFDEVLL